MASLNLKSYETNTCSGPDYPEAHVKVHCRGFHVINYFLLISTLLSKCIAGGFMWQSTLSCSDDSFLVIWYHDRKKLKATKHQEKVGDCLAGTIKRRFNYYNSNGILRYLNGKNNVLLFILSSNNVLCRNPESLSKKQSNQPKEYLGIFASLS